MRAPSIPHDFHYPAYACRVCGAFEFSREGKQSCPGRLDIAANIDALRDIFRAAKRQNKMGVMEDCLVAHKRAATVPHLIALNDEYCRRLVIFRERLAADYAAWKAAIMASPTGYAAAPQSTAVFPMAHL